MEVQQIHAEIFPHCVPGFVAGALDTLYGNTFSSLEHWRACGSLTSDVSTYVAWQGSEPLAILLFRQSGQLIQVLNEAIAIAPQEMRRFCEHAFETLPQATLIRFHAVRTAPCVPGRPCQRHNYSEDIVVPLPDSPDAYVKSLGKATRKDVTHHLHQVERAFPSFRYAMYAAEEANEETIREIMRFNRMRFPVAGSGAPAADAELERLLRLVRLRGAVGVAHIEGKVCGGAICTRAGANYYSHVNAHDPRYDIYSLGTVCCYLTICECIRRGGREFHLLWGRNDYKYRLGGIEHGLEDVVVYRSWAHCLLRADVAVAAASRGVLRVLRLRLHDWRHAHAAQPARHVPASPCENRREFP